MQRLCRVLIVEDNPVIQYIHKAMLTVLNCNVEIASNAKEALEMASDEYDLILLDIGLPDRSGIEVAIELRAREKKKRTHIVALTAFAEREVMKRCLEVGIDQVVYKPIDFQGLKQLLQVSHA